MISGASVSRAVHRRLSYWATALRVKQADTLTDQTRKLLSTLQGAKRSLQLAARLHCVALAPRSSLLVARTPLTPVVYTAPTSQFRQSPSISQTNALSNDRLRLRNGR
jgi:hypothetical protein